MSEPIPESVPTSHDPRSQRPTKRQAVTPRDRQASALDVLFAHPDRDIDTASPTAKGLAPPPEIVANVQGSSAGAGSGEFHVYKASRRREYERLRGMEEEVRAEREAAAFEREKGEKAEREARRMGKNKRRRDKAKERKKGKGEGREEEERVEERVEEGKIGKGKGGVAEKPVEETVGVVIHDDD